MTPHLDYQEIVTLRTVAVHVEEIATVKNIFKTECLDLLLVLILYLVNKER